MSIPVIDLFSGPGGLGEGFSSCLDGATFRIAVSAEMDAAAHSTLLLRSYFRRLKAAGEDLRSYYDFCHGTQPQPWNAGTLSIWKEAAAEARNLTLGTPEGDSELDKLLDSRLKGRSECVLIGGPPCQAYSIVGRVRNRGKVDYRAENDHRHFLYREYLRVLQKVRPAAFVMENVKGILSSKVGERQIFQEILLDLVDPDAAVTGQAGSLSSCYRIHSLTVPTQFRRGMDVEDIDPRDFVICAENYGIPQARHRVILLGIREDIEGDVSTLSAAKNQVSLRDAIGDLPKIRSRLSRTEDSAKEWAKTVTKYMTCLSRLAGDKDMAALARELKYASSQVPADLGCGGTRVRPEGVAASKSKLAKSLSDPELMVVLNHEARAHMSKDLRRYAFASTFASIGDVSPKGHEDFKLHGLAPKHKNWKSGNFADRFRVQVWGKPSTTITSHIAKDGHYFIHPDPTQCRTLTVREAARLQTFPDNYFFQGNRTDQYHQVGNAVPPLLAEKIAQIVSELLKLS